MTNVAKSINLSVAFLLELAMLVSFAYWGYQTGKTTIVKIALGIGVPLVIGVVWGVFMAPKSSRRLKGSAYLALKILLFGSAVVALFNAGTRPLGIVLALVFIINTCLLYLWRQ
jgi:hypothetical protein